MDEYMAHTPNKKGEWHTLKEHTDEVLNESVRISKKFGGEFFLYYAALWHDAGKINPDFQNYLFSCYKENFSAKSVNHKSYGSLWSFKIKEKEPWQRVIAIIIEGHHNKIKDLIDLRFDIEHKFENTINSENPDKIEKVFSLALENNFLSYPNEKDRYVMNNILKDKFVECVDKELFLRFCYSALVDADFLDTSKHFNFDDNSYKMDSISRLLSIFNVSFNNFQNKSNNSEIHNIRNSIHKKVLEQAKNKPGLFSLEIPTGGGKTLTSMSFALNHAKENNFERIIVATPFISITSQTADVYRSMFKNAEHNIVEHHSDTKTDSFSLEEEMQRKFLIETWEAPIIVTTLVRLISTLSSNKPSTSRRFHRLINSVIIIDEIQSVPVHLLGPFLGMIEQLTEQYKISVVFSSATQLNYNSLEKILKNKNIDFSEPQLLIDNASELFEQMKRVEYKYIKKELTWNEVFSLTKNKKQTLTIVNTRKDAIKLINEHEKNKPLKEIGYLSTFLCPEHRKNVLNTAKQKIEKNEPYHLVSTQIIEAGVDIDFPVVYRALAPLDSIIQASGRCNREGKKEKAETIIFKPIEGTYPFSGYYKTASELTKKYLNNLDKKNINNPKTIKKYFEELYKQKEDLDEKRIHESRKQMKFETVYKNFKLIEDQNENIIVLYGSNNNKQKIEKLIQELTSNQFEKKTIIKKLKPYTISLPFIYIQNNEHLLKPIIPGFYKWLGEYDKIKGIILNKIENNDEPLIF